MSLCLYKSYCDYIRHLTLANHSNKKKEIMDKQECPDFCSVEIKNECSVKVKIEDEDEHCEAIIITDQLPCKVTICDDGKTRIVKRKRITVVQNEKIWRQFAEECSAWIK